MEKKNISVLKTLILLGMIIAPSFYLFSSYSPRHIPAGKRSIAYRKGSPQRRRRSPQLVKSVPEEAVSHEPAQAEQINKELPQEDEMEEPSEPTASQSGQKDVQVASAPAPGMLTALYATIAPIILITLNKALEGGIAVSTQGFIQQWMARQSYMSLRNKFLDQANTLFTKEDLEKSSDDDKVEAAMLVALQQQRLSPKEVRVFNQLKDQSSISSIFGRVVSLGALNTFAQMTGSIVGLLATMALQTLMPSK